MDEADLVRQLHDEGFSAPENWRDLFFRNSATRDEIRIPAQDPALKYATFSSFSLPFCDVTWWVLWHSNQDGKITDARGNVGASWRPARLSRLWVNSGCGKLPRACLPSLGP